MGPHAMLLLCRSLSKTPVCFKGRVILLANDLHSAAHHILEIAAVTMILGVHLWLRLPSQSLQMLQCFVLSG